jgi:hypothetical protein
MLGLEGARLGARALSAVAVVIVCGSTTIGCADRACFELAESAAVCPSRSDAATQFGGCTNIQSVDSDGTLEDGACCYDVTHTVRGLACEPSLPGNGGAPTTHSHSHSRSVVEVSTHTHTSVATFVGSGGHGGFGGGGGGVGGNGGQGGASCSELECGFAPNEPLFGCLACARDTTCGQANAACNQSADCVDYESCVAQCDVSSAPCRDACASQFPEGASVFAVFIGCELCGPCATACASNPVTALDSTACDAAGGGGASGAGGGATGGSGLGGGGTGGGGTGGHGGGDGTGGAGGHGGALGVGGLGGH